MESETEKSEYLHEAAELCLRREGGAVLQEQDVLEDNSR